MGGEYGARGRRWMDCIARLGKRASVRENASQISQSSKINNERCLGFARHDKGLDRHFAEIAATSGRAVDKAARNLAIARLPELLSRQCGSLSQPDVAATA